MRWSSFYLFTTREVPADAEVVSHQLMIRAGMIRKVAAGVYSYLPLGWRSVRKMSEIVRREMDAAGAVELSMPAIHPAELWQETGRWEVFGDLLLKIQDRHERDFCFGPTHEEVVTDIVRRDVRSYRQLPFNLYQIQTKFRDEIRPRFGLMRAREFIMKDAYSFHADEASLGESYEAMRKAYCLVFEDCKLRYSMVEAHSGAIGGSASHEFMVLADTGEDAVVSCPSCGYGANVEKAEVGEFPPPPAEEAEESRRVDTPGKTTVTDIADMLGVGAERIVKTMLYETGVGDIAVVIRGDREVNELKLAAFLGTDELRLAGESTVRRLSGAPVGFAGPVGLADGVRLLGDFTVQGRPNFVCGANEADAHLTGVNWGREVDISEWADLLVVGEGDPCPRCDGNLVFYRGIEVGHIFQLGTKYSESMGCVYADENGENHPMHMGCYGLGVGRTVAAAIEQNHDKDGIIWPLPLAPFEVLLASLGANDENVCRATEEIYDALRAKGVEVFYDDRPERPGVKFKDADLLGFPVRLVVGARSLAEGKVELSLRRDREKHLIPVAEAVSRVLELLDTLR